jgi:HSP20 family protein
MRGEETMLRTRGTLLPVRTDRVAVDRMLEDLFEGFPFGTVAWNGPQTTIPAVNSWEDEKNYYVEAELPGFSEKEIDVSVLGNELRLSGSRETEHEEKKAFHRRERTAGKIERILRFPVEIDAGKIDAVFKNGVLTVTLPKAQAALPRKIEVRG